MSPIPTDGDEPKCLKENSMGQYHRGVTPSQDGNASQH